MFLALVLGVLALLGDESFARLQGFRGDLNKEVLKNQELKTYVDDLKRDVWALKKDERRIEKSARENLGLARPDEKIFLFKEGQ